MTFLHTVRMQISTLDGVTVLSLPAPGPLDASLVFAAGVAHSTFRTHNLPHLLEHMIAGPCHAPATSPT